MTVLNPVLRRELVERWRGRRAVATLSAYLAVLGGICYLMYRVGEAVLRSNFFAFGEGPDVTTAGPMLGRFLVEGLLFFVLLLMLFVAPGYAAAQVSGERERRTLTLLQVTLLRPYQIVLGKLGASSAWLSLLVVAALPIGAAAFFLGGVGVEDLLRGILMILALGICVSCIALGISSITRRTTGSIVLTYAVVLLLTLGTLFLSAVEAVVRNTRGEQIRTPVAMYVNPFFGLADAVQAQGPSQAFFGLPSPLGLFAELLPDMPMVGGPRGVDVAVAEPIPPDEFRSGPRGGPPPLDPGPPPRDRFVVVGEEPPLNRPRQPIWLITLGFYVVLAMLGLLLATRRLRVVEPRGRVSIQPTPQPPTPTPAGPDAS